MVGLKEVSKFILDQIDHNRECGKDDEITLEEIASIIARRVLGGEERAEIKPVVRYSREPFEGYTDRYVINMEVEGNVGNLIPITIYSNSSSYSEVAKYVRQRVISKVLSMNLYYRATREQDESDARIIDEVMSGRKL